MQSVHYSPQYNADVGLKEERTKKEFDGLREDLSAEK